MTKEDYLVHIGKMLRDQGVKSHLTQQLIEAVAELLEYYSVEFVHELLPSLFKMQSEEEA